VARTTGVPRDSPAADDRSGGEPAMSGSSGLYGHFIRTPNGCQAFSFGVESGNTIQGASSFSSERGTSPTASAETVRLCLLSQPILTRTVRRFTCLPRGSHLVTLGAASWRRYAVRGWHAGRRCRGVGNHSAAAAIPASRAGVAGAAGPYPGFATQRNRNRRPCVMLLGRAPSACFEE
jgi:hypothetical protein